MSYETQVLAIGLNDHSEENYPNTNGYGISLNLFVESRSLSALSEENDVMLIEGTLSVSF